MVRIPRGASLSAAAETLAIHRVIDSPWRFRLYASLTGSERAIRAGVYEFPLSLPMSTVLDILVRGSVAQRRVAVPEGLMLEEIADLFEREFRVPRDRFLDSARHQPLLAELRIPAESIEGYLYPSTYLFRVDVGVGEVIRQMVTEHRARWRPEWNGRLDSLGMSHHEVVTLASIIEGEVRYGPDRPFVSSVYHNRLMRRMRLQADPTVIYALGKRRRLFERDYRFPSPYNTYLIDGLPPGPIGQPSEASLEAALYPARTDFLFFVARGDGKHVFSRSHREHLAAIRVIRRPR